MTTQLTAKTPIQLFPRPILKVAALHLQAASYENGSIANRVLEATSPKMTLALAVTKDSAQAIAKHFVVKARSRQAFTLRAAHIVSGSSPLPPDLSISYFIIQN